MGKIRTGLGVCACGILLLMGHAVGIVEIYGPPVTFEQILWFIPPYIHYLFFLSSGGFLGWISYQLITKGYNKGLDRVLGRL